MNGTPHDSSINQTHWQQVWGEIAPDITQDFRQLAIPVLILIIWSLGSFIVHSLSVPKNISETPLGGDAVIPVSSTEIVRGDTTKKQIIFTFDGGDAPTSATQILDTLKQHGVHTTFFLTGKFIENNPDIVRRMHEEGHEIFSHTYSHPHLTELTDEQIREQFDGMNMALKNILGPMVTSRPFFRPPYGDRDGRVRTVAADYGFQSIYWTYDAQDWRESEGVTADEVKRNIFSTLANGNIYLLHIGDTIMGSILDDVIVELNKRGFAIVSLTQGMNPTQIQMPAPNAPNLPL